jgi:hypothetical protein
MRRDEGIGLLHTWATVVPPFLNCEIKVKPESSLAPTRGSPRATLGFKTVCRSGTTQDLKGSRYMDEVKQKLRASIGKHSNGEFESSVLCTNENIEWNCASWWSLGFSLRFRTILWPSFCDPWVSASVIDCALLNILHSGLTPGSHESPQISFYPKHRRFWSLWLYGHFYDRHASRDLMTFHFSESHMYFKKFPTQK